MDNIQLILYIVFVVGYLIFKALTGKKKEQPEAGPETGQDPPRKARPAPTFEDILKELTGVDTEEPLPERVDKPRREASKKAEEISEHVQESYERATEEAKKAEKLDERIDLEPPRKKITVEETSRETVENDYLAWMQDADDAKKAFVLSEIINRKY